ncbi:hypothetical protein MPL3356_350079 [Mesorhizobium plurifarium]|uniref:Uncharacterized protein n=1 Tax=Mesorhizobium plurifarium TaxID=69974 RepID=A0A090DWI5_MESPL|nr:hypothetical protein MPL3356_350079 [Mesorhizobium plurifarium]
MGSPNGALEEDRGHLDGILRGALATTCIELGENESIAVYPH